MPWPLVGMEAVTSNLSQMISSHRLPHALLLSGLPGGGKNTLARALAASLNCSSPGEDAAPCGLCLSCQKISRDVHPDLITVGPEGKANQIKMDEIKIMRGKMAFRPYEGRVKVFIVREVDRLSFESGNALLKTLEEPPPDSHLILTTASVGAVMQTITSRCLGLKLPPLSQAAILNFLKENRGLIGPKALLLAALSDGALGPALTLDAEETWRRWQEVDMLMDGRGAARLEAAWDWIKGQDFEAHQAEVLTILHLWWRETARLSALGPQGLEGPPPSSAQTRWAGHLSPKVLERLAAAWRQLEDSLGRSIKPGLPFENFWLSIFQLDNN